jgi:DNA replication and repair protein RecF
MLKTIYIEGYRNLNTTTLEFNDGVNLFAGPNGAGKTNLLEAIGLFALGKSCLGAKDQAMVNFQSRLATVKAIIEKRKKKLT